MVATPRGAAEHLREHGPRGGAAISQDLAGAPRYQEGINGESLGSAILGGAIITLMTWTQRGTPSVTGKLVAAFSAAFLLAAGHLNHAIVASLEMFAALHAGVSFSYLTWVRLLGWYSLGNFIGGVGLVTVLRLVQVGAAVIKEEQAG